MTTCARQLTSNALVEQKYGVLKGSVGGAFALDLPNRAPWCHVALQIAFGVRLTPSAYRNFRSNGLNLDPYQWVDRPTQILERKGGQ